MRLPTSSACVNGIVSVVNRFFIIFTLQSLDKLRNLMTKSTGQLIMYLQQKSIINMWKKLAKLSIQYHLQPRRQQWFQLQEKYDQVQDYEHFTKKTLMHVLMTIL